MAIRPRTPRTVALAGLGALGLASLLLVGPSASASVAQDPGFAPGTEIVEPAVPDTAPGMPLGTADPGAEDSVDDGTSTTLIEGEAPPARRVASENRRVMAVIGGLVFVALALSLLTVRYWRATRPVPLEIVETDELFVSEVPGRSRRGGRRSRRAVAGADHASADDDWEPRATGEHAQIDLEVVGAHRPDRAARRRALGLPDA